MEIRVGRMTIRWRENEHGWYADVYDGPDCVMREQGATAIEAVSKGVRFARRWVQCGA